MTVHDNVVAVIISELWAFEVFLICVNGTKLGQGHPDDSVCNDSIRHINLPEMNTVHKLLCLSEETTEDYSRSSHYDRLSQGQAHPWTKTQTTPQSVRVCLVVSRLSLQSCCYVTVVSLTSVV